MQLVLLHGFMGTGADWGPVRERMHDVDILTPDLPGHGSAVGLPEEAYSLAGAAAFVAQQFNGPAVVAGYSMGGRVAMRLARDLPDRVAGLGLIAAHPGLTTAPARSARLKLDTERAARLREDFPLFLERWMALPLFSGMDPQLRGQIIRRRLRQNPAELARALVGLSTGRQEPTEEFPGDAVLPVRYLAGALDEGYAAIARNFENRGRVAPGVGHNVLAEAPDLAWHALDGAGRPVVLLTAAKASPNHADILMDVAAQRAT